MYVYAIRAADAGQVKIGFSKNPRQRARTLGKGLELVAAVCGGREVERSIHRVLEPFRVQGEWFRDCPDVLAAFCHYENVPLAELPQPRVEESHHVLIRARLTEAEWIAIRHDAVDREMPYGEYAAMLIRAGRECIDNYLKEGVA